MSRCTFSRVRCWVLVALCASLLGGSGPAAVGAPNFDSSPEQVWSTSIDLIESGDFDAASARIDELERLGRDGARIAEWLREQQEMGKTRAEMTHEDLEKYIQWAQEQHAKDKIQRALGYATMAYDNSTDKDAFREQEWLRKLYDDALEYAADLREKHEWLDAHAVYFQLAAIFEHDKQIRKLRHECLTHARLEVFYKPDTKWEEQLAGIEWRMVRDVLYKIDKYYVSEADFRKLTVAGLEQLLMLARSEAVREVFPSLEDELDRQAFIDRIEERLRQVQAADRVTFVDTGKMFDRVREINMQTVQIPETVIVSEFVTGAMETLDEFSTVIWPVEFREFDKRTTGEFIGVGISIAKRNSELVVVTPLEDSPAYYAGVLADDVITKVDGVDTADMSLTKAVETITGPPNTTVTLTVRRQVDGLDKEIDFKLKRRLVTIQSVKGYTRDAEDTQGWKYMVDPEMGIGYLRLVNFDQNTVDQLRTVITSLQKNEGLKGLILDLRANPGGLLRSAVETSELFLREDQKIVSTKGERTPEYPPITSRITGPFASLPLAVLINEASASASEIVSGALKDHKRATIIGERTFGKFSVQNLMQIDGTDAHVKLTTAAYYLPSGKSLHRTEDATEWGVDPDIAVPVVPKELAKMYAIRRDADVIRPVGWEPSEESEDDADADATADAEEATDKPDETAADEPAEELGDDVKTDADQQADDQAKVEDKDESKGDDEDKEDEEPLPPDPNERPEIDPQLETALLVMRVKLMDEHRTQVALQHQEADIGVD